MVSVELGNQVTVLIDECKLLGVTREHHLVNVNLEKLLLLRLALRFEEDVVDRSFLAAYDGFDPVLVHVLRLVIHHDLLLQLQVSLAEYQNLSFARNIDIGVRANSRENFDSFILAVDSGDESQVV